MPTIVWSTITLSEAPSAPLLHWLSSIARSTSGSPISSSLKAKTECTNGIKFHITSFTVVRSSASTTWCWQLPSFKPHKEGLVYSGFPGNEWGVWNRIMQWTVWVNCWFLAGKFFCRTIANNRLDFVQRFSRETNESPRPPKRLNWGQKESHGRGG